MAVGNAQHNSYLLRRRWRPLPGNESTKNDPRILQTTEPQLSRSQPRTSNHALPQSWQDQIVSQQQAAVGAERSEQAREEDQSTHLRTAETLLLAAEQLAHTGNMYQCAAQAEQAAEQYLVGGDTQAAARTYLQAAETLLTHALTPELAWRPLEQATKLAENVPITELRLAILLARARLAFATFSDADAQQFLAQAWEILPTIGDTTERGELAHKLGSQHAVLAMVWEDWDTARDVLNTALAACPPTARREKSGLLQLLLQLNTERGDWNAADQAYQEARELLTGAEAPPDDGRLAMQYGASLARRGSIEEAYTTYRESIERVESGANRYSLWLAYHNMQHMLLRNGALFFPDMEKHDRRRLDLFGLTISENQGYQHSRQAIEDLDKQQYRGALQHTRLALARYWSDGSWSGIEHAYQLLARVFAAIGEPVEALLAAIRAGDTKATEQYSGTLNSISNAHQLAEALDGLMPSRPAVSEQQAATIALGSLADVIPPQRLEQALEHMLTLLQGPTDNQLKENVRQYAAQALANLVRQCSGEQTTRIIRVTLDQLQRQQFWTVTEELLKLLYRCLVDNYVDPVLHPEIADVTLRLAKDSSLRTLAEQVAVQLGRAALPDIRTRIVDYLRTDSDDADRLAQLVFLDEPVAEEALAAQVDQILQAIRPEPEIVETDGKHSQTLTMSSVTPRALINFNKVLPSPLIDRVIDGLIGAVTHEHTSMWVRSDAVRTLGDLPANALRRRADQIVTLLLVVARGNLPYSSSVAWELESQTNPLSNIHMNTGTIPSVQRNCLHTLGKLYGFASEEQRTHIDELLIEASRNTNVIIRQGVAMALNAIEYDVSLPQRLLLRLFALLADAMPEPRAWACSASGRLIARGLAGAFAGYLFEELLAGTTAQEVEVRLGAAVGLRALAQRPSMETTEREIVAGALKHLSNDVSFRVRREAEMAATLLAVAPAPDSARARARAALKAAGLLTEPGTNLRKLADPFVSPEQLRDAMERAGKGSLSELVLAEREPHA